MADVAFRVLDSDAQARLDATATATRAESPTAAMIRELAALATGDDWSPWVEITGIKGRTGVGTSANRQGLQTQWHPNRAEGNRLRLKRKPAPQEE